MREWRARAIFLSLAIWVSSLFAAIGEQQKAWRLAVDPVVSATIRRVWLQHQGKGGPHLFAHLVFDRKGPDGQTVHCDVPEVNVNSIGRKLSAGDTIEIAPQPDECWEPDVISETNAPWTPRRIGIVYAVSALSGLLCVFVMWRAIQGLRRDAATYSKVA